MVMCMHVIHAMDRALRGLDQWHQSIAAVLNKSTEMFWLPVFAPKHHSEQGDKECTAQCAPDYICARPWFRSWPASPHSLSQRFR